ncbi:MAG: zinc ribbon domain-containing protein [Betaproteobacteria bacterium]
MSHPRSATDTSTLRPWQFFTLLALFCATAAVFVTRGTSRENVIFICLAIGAAALVGLGALRTLWPLVTTEPFEAEMVGNRTRVALEREKNLVLRTIKELEFDHAMGKISPGDYDEMVRRLRTRAARLLKQLDNTGTGYREIIERELASRLGKLGAAPITDSDLPGVRGEGQGVSVPGACSKCATLNDEDAKFCKSCGAKLFALLFALLTFVAPAFAQIQMPDPKQMSGIPRPVTDLPEGHVSVRLIRGQLSNNLPGHPVELHAGTKVITVKTDENGRAEFSGVAQGTSVKAVAVVDGERLESQEFPWPSEGGIRLMLVATDKTAGAAAPVFQAQTGNVVLGDQTRVIIDLADEALQVYYLLDIQNSARVPVNPPKAFLLDMPTGAQGTTIMGGPPTAIARGERVTVMGPFPPGQTSVQLAYSFPYTSGDVSFTQTIPVPAGSVAVLMKKVGAMTMSSPQLPSVQERDFEGEKYVLAQGPPIAAGGNLTLNVGGLPHHNPAPRRIALTLVSAIFALAAWAAARTPKPPSDSGRVKQLTSRREKIFAELLKLEQQRRAGAVDPARYSERRPVLMLQLERVYRDLDAESGQGLAA